MSRLGELEHAARRLLVERGQLRQNLAATQQLLAQLVTAYDPAGGGGAQRAGAELDSVQCAEQVVTQNCPFSEKNVDGFNPPCPRLPARPRSCPRGCWAAGPPSPRSCSSWPASTSRPTRPPRPSCGGCWGPAGGRWRAGRHDACMNCNIRIISAPPSVPAAASTALASTARPHLLRLGDLAASPTQPEQVSDGANIFRLLPNIFQFRTCSHCSGTVHTV